LQKQRDRRTNKKRKKRNDIIKTQQFPGTKVTVVFISKY
jgi:hypothetical protein